MIEGFDKEIDALLRRTAAGETAFADINPKSQISNPESFHPDADEISAFAENVLPEKLKQNYTAHFAECDRCRTILVNTIALDAEAETKSVFVAAPSIAASIPWHRKFFAFPQLAYALGALIVLFGGFFAFLVVRNANEATGAADVSQTYETQPIAGGPSFNDETEFAAPDSISNAAMASNAASNTMMSNTASMSNSASTATSNSMTSVSANSAARSANANSTAAQPAAPPKAAQTTEADQSVPQKRAEAQSTDATGNSAARLNESENKAGGRQADEETVKVEQAAPRVESLPLSARNTTSTIGTDSDSPKAKSRKPASSDPETRRIGGATFTRKEGVWYDANYKGQATTNVSRGSDNYTKLDAGLRSIAGNLNGTVVIIWKSKAYRIQ